MPDYIDITPTVTEAMQVYPGDIPVSREFVLDWKKGDHLLLSGMRSTVHVGAHADAPNHYREGGQDIASRRLEYYMGPCQVMRLALAAGRRGMPGDVNLDAIQAPRVLFRTDSFADRTRWRTDYNSLSPELIAALAGRGVSLVGIDTPSIDPDDSKKLESHQAVFEHDMAILEGLDLSGAADGVYTLIALPLKLGGFDGAPVRAILLKNLHCLTK